MHPSHFSKPKPHCLHLSDQRCLLTNIKRLLVSGYQGIDGLVFKKDGRDGHYLVREKTITD